ncbi:MAG: hypothetical protein KIS92_16850 [Planctomycetota bacterium]|nr:hypothetical protein [Planctomycetota bacterium]
MPLTPEQRNRNNLTDLPAMLGSVVIGAIVPCVLTWVRLEGHSEVFHEWSRSFGVEPSEPWQFSHLAGMMGASALACGTFSLFLAIMLKRHLVNTCSEQTESKALERRSAKLGALVAFLNFPGYLALVLFPLQVRSFFQVLLLFLVTGATCGLWIGWQAYRVYQPDLGFVPRFTLRTLMALVFAWGVLLALFSPQR